MNTRAQASLTSKFDRNLGVQVSAGQNSIAVLQRLRIFVQWQEVQNERNGVVERRRLLRKAGRKQCEGWRLSLSGRFRLFFRSILVSLYVFFKVAERGHFIVVLKFRVVNLYPWLLRVWAWNELDWGDVFGCTFELVWRRGVVHVAEDCLCAMVRWSAVRQVWLGDSDILRLKDWKGFIDQPLEHTDL